MLDALGRALRLDLDARGHVFRLAGLAPFIAETDAPEQVDAALSAVRPEAEG